MPKYSWIYALRKYSTHTFTPPVPLKPRSVSLRNTFLMEEPKANKNSQVKIKQNKNHEIYGKWSCIKSGFHVTNTPFLYACMAQQSGSQLFRNTVEGMNSIRRLQDFVPLLHCSD